MFSLPEPDPGPGPEIEPVEPQSPWSAADIIAFVVFFIGVWLILPYSFIHLWQVFKPTMKVTDLTAVDQVLLQGVMNVVLVGFIALLIKRVHGKSFFETIHWNRNYDFRNTSLVGVGAMLAISVLVVSSFFPPSSPPPLEQLLSSTSAMYVFAVFGICVAPLFEEVIFRGFLFKVLSDMGGPVVAMATTASLFAFLHVFQLWGSWAGIALIFVVGCILAFIRYRSNSLIPSFIVHTSYNAMLFSVFALGSFVEKSPK
ncbi:MAG TPA: CPBP family intramembrane glutamic endopeptidase [Terriglobia bacterium]|nr:CPBP family intramembrane glutamic endopeptidase [Terriglobia bacterium]